jgi:hypothetical protein
LPGKSAVYWLDSDQLLHLQKKVPGKAADPSLSSEQVWHLQQNLPGKSAVSRWAASICLLQNLPGK